MKEGVREKLFLLGLHSVAKLVENESKACDQVCWGQTEHLVSSQLEAQRTECLCLCLSIYLHEIAWMFYLTTSDFPAYPHSICSRDKLLCSWRHLQWQLYQREEKNLLESDQMLS